MQISINKEIALVVIPTVSRQVLVSYTCPTLNGRTVYPVSRLIALTDEGSLSDDTGRPEAVIKDRFNGNVKDFEHLMQERSKCLWVMQDYSVPVKQNDLRWIVPKPTVVHLPEEGQIPPETDEYAKNLNKDDRLQYDEELLLGRVLLRYLHLLATRGSHEYEAAEEHLRKSLNDIQEYFRSL